MDPHGPTAKRFPLVARVRPVCLPLDARVGRLGELADRAWQDGNPAEASTVFNQAALVASDVGLPDLAREWCHRHARLYLAHCPLNGMNAIRALEPLVNLARLHLRAGRRRHGLQLLLLLQRAVADRTAVTVGGVTVPADLTDETGQDEVGRWLWRVVLADGTRALTADGHWHAALQHLEQHHGVGVRMLDGRQVAVIANAATGDFTKVNDLLTATTPGEPWENAVTACLGALCQPSNIRPTTRQLSDLRAAHDEITFHPGMLVFRTRLTLSITDAHAHAVNRSVADRLVHELTEQILATADGYAARELLGHAQSRPVLRTAHTSALAGLVAASGLDSARFPPSLERRLGVALHAAGALLTEALTSGVVPALRR